VPTDDRRKLTLSIILSGEALKVSSPAPSARNPGCLPKLRLKTAQTSEASARYGIPYGIGKPFHVHSSAAGRVCATVGRSTCLALRANRNW
jgi:hypothetical protein